VVSILEKNMECPALARIEIGCLKEEEDRKGRMKMKIKLEI